VKATEVTAGLAESNGSLLPGLWRDSLHVTCGLTACTPGSAPGPALGNEYGKTLPLPLVAGAWWQGCTWRRLAAVRRVCATRDARSPTRRATRVPGSASVCWVAPASEACTVIAVCPATGWEPTARPQGHPALLVFYLFITHEAANKHTQTHTHKPNTLPQSTYHSTDLLTARGVAHLVVHGTSGSTSYETISPVR